MVADGRKLAVESVGSIQGRINDDVTLSISDVHYCPDMTTNLFSVFQMAGAGHLVVFKDDKCILYPKEHHPVLSHDEKTIAISTTAENGSYKLRLKKDSLLSAFAKDSNCSSNSPPSWSHG